MLSPEHKPLSSVSSEVAERATIARRASISAAVGTAIEFYDFTIYAFLATIIAPLFFSKHDEVAGLLATLGVYAVGYVARPLGSIYFGRLGDRQGRRRALLITITVMGVATALTGLLPTYAAIGVAAPTLLTVLRIVQSLAAGGELGGAAVLVAESAPRKRRGFLGSSTAIGAAGGATLAAVVVGTVSVMPAHAMSSWGWRVPFLLAVPLLIVCLVYRLRVEESPVFQQMASETAPPKAPVSDVVANHWKALLKVTLTSYALNTAAKLSSLYLVVQFHLLGYPVAQSVWFAAGFTFVSGTVMTYAGQLSDQFGRRRVMAVGFVGFIVLAIPCYMLMAASLLAALFAGLILNVVDGLITGVVFTAFSEQFPKHVRYTGVSLGYNLGTAFGGGPASLVAAALVSSTGVLISPAFYIVIVSVIGLGTVAVFDDREQSDL